MSDLIKREDAIKAEADRVYKVLHSEGCKETYEECLADAEKTFKDIPSAENKGEWVDSDGDTYCSNCGEEVPIDGWEYKYRDKIRLERTNFCPNCGADMRGEK